MKGGPLVLMMLLLMGCGQYHEAPIHIPGNDIPSNVSEPVETIEEREPAMPETPGLTLRFEEGLNNRQEWLRSLLGEEETFKLYTDHINSALTLPHSDIIFGPCREETAWHNEEMTVVCYELVEYIGQTVYDEEIYPDADNTTKAVTAAIFMHEVAKSIAGAAEINTTERSIDGLATVLAVRSGTQDMLMKGARFLELESERARAGTRTRRLPYWLTHTPNPERFRNIMCMIQGSSDQGLTQCRVEYEKAANSWDALLSGRTAG